MLLCCRVHLFWLTVQVVFVLGSMGFAPCLPCLFTFVKELPSLLCRSALTFSEKLPPEWHHLVLTVVPRVWLRTRHNLVEISDKLGAIGGGRIHLNQNRKYNSLYVHSILSIAVIEKNRMPTLHCVTMGCFLGTRGWKIPNHNTKKVWLKSAW